MRKIALIRPFHNETLSQLNYPMGLGYLAAVCKKKGYIVRIYDLNVLHYSNELFVEELNKRDFDFIGVFILTYFFRESIELCNLIKNRSNLKEKILIIGGVHSSALPELSLRKTQADYAVIGEGEITLLNLLDAINNNSDIHKINGIGYIRDGRYIQNEPQQLIENLDDIPYPAWDLMHPELYPVNPHGFYYKKKPIFPILTSRGCPFSCTFCASKNFWKQRIRFHSINRVVDEIEYLVKHYGAKEIHIWDDNFTLNRQRVIEFCREIKKRNLKLNFACPSGLRVDTLDETMLKYMKSVGFWSLSIAIESGSERILKGVNKQIDLKKIPALLKFAKRLGFFTRAFFIYGLPGETPTDIHQTITYAKSVKIDQAQFTFFSPLPGSSFFVNWIKDKDIWSMEWDKFDFYINPQDMTHFNKISKSDLFKFQRFLHIQFNLLRPWILIKNMTRWKLSNYLIQIDRIKFVISHIIR